MASLDVRFVGTVARVNQPYTKSGASWSVVSMVVNGRFYVGRGAESMDTPTPGVDYIEVVDLQLARFRQNDQVDQVFNAIPGLQRGTEIDAWLTFDTMMGERGVGLRVGPLQSLTVVSRPDAASIPASRRREAVAAS